MFLSLPFSFIFFFFTPYVLASPKRSLVVSDQYLFLFEDASPEQLEQFENEVITLGGTVNFKHKVGFAVVAGLSPDVAKVLGSLPYVSQSLQDDIIVLDPDFLEPTQEIVQDVPESAPESASDPTMAYFYPRQWDMKAIDADVAWEAGRLGSSAVTVAILDTGIDHTYPDLVGRVDLARSISFVNSEPSTTDYNYHGTHVASTVTSNSNIFAGVTTETMLMAIKVCSVDRSCGISSIISGVLYAADNGADVANMSLGGDFIKKFNGQFLSFLTKVFNYANRKKMTIIVSAGNGAADLDHDGNIFRTYCDMPNVICVAATGPTNSDDTRRGPWYEVDAPAKNYTNFGRSAINVAAPGGTRYGRIWAACSQNSTTYRICGRGIFVLGIFGTSMAAPHVSGLAALVVEDVGKNPARVKAAIQKGAEDLGEKGVDPYYGKGRINVALTLGI